jgi:hypothetical protein
LKFSKPHRQDKAVGAYQEESFLLECRHRPIHGPDLEAEQATVFHGPGSLPGTEDRFGRPGQLGQRLLGKRLPNLGFKVAEKLLGEALQGGNVQFPRRRDRFARRFCTGLLHLLSSYNGGYIARGTNTLQVLLNSPAEFLREKTMAERSSP